MTGNRNGFADALNRLNTLMDVGQEVDLDVLEEAANFYASKLKPLIPKGDGNQHLQDELKVVIKNGHVQLIFSDKAWYWHLVNHGHKKRGGKGRVKGHHFVRKALNQHGPKTAELMQKKIIEKMEG